MRYGLDLDGSGAGGRFEAHERPGRADLGDGAGPKGRGDPGEEGQLVLPANHPAEVDPPHLGAAARVAQRLERDPHLHGPAVFEPGRPGVPDRGPVAVGWVLIGDEAVEEPADRVHVEEEGVPAVVEGVEDDREILVVEDAEVVPPHLGRHHAVGLAVPVPAGDVHRLVVIEDPDVGRLGGRFALERERLDEAADPGHPVVDGVVETAVEIERFGEAGGPHGRSPGLVAPDHLGKLGGRGTAYHGGRRRRRALTVLVFGELGGLRPQGGRRQQGGSENQANHGTDQGAKPGRRNSTSGAFPQTGSTRVSALAGRDAGDQAVSAV